MKIVIFGIGGTYKQNKKDIEKEDEIIAFVDNDCMMQGKIVDGLKVYHPEAIIRMQYDKIVIMSKFSIDIREQLLKIGCQSGQILHYLEYISQQRLKKIEVYFAKKIGCFEKNCLIITESLDYHGGAITAVYAALALQSKGYGIVIAASSGNDIFIREYEKKGIIFILYQGLQFAKRDDIPWIDYFQSIIINTYPMILCGMEIALYRKVSIWLHESDVIYRYMDYWKENIMKKVISSNMTFYAVSDVARENFWKNIGRCNIKVLPYGIPDKVPDENEIIYIKNVHLTFAVIGTIHPVKNQVLFLNAIRQLKKEYQMNNDFLIIGECTDKDYLDKLHNCMGRNKNVKFIKRQTREELEKLYKRIDVVVISSLQETMSLVATEAMMYGKVCILCDTAGMAEYVDHRENGLIYKTGNAHSLAEQMSYCIENKDYLFEIGKCARKTYTELFGMKTFGDRLEKII